MNRIKNNYDFTISLIFSFLLWFISTWEAEKKPEIFTYLRDDLYSEHLFPERLKYTFFLSFFFIIIRVIFFSSNIKKNLVKSIISIYIQDNYTSNDNNRVTIYKATY